MADTFILGTTGNGIGTLSKFLLKGILNDQKTRYKDDVSIVFDCSGVYEDIIPDGATIFSIQKGKPGLTCSKAREDGTFLPGDVFYIKTGFEPNIKIDEVLSDMEQVISNFWADKFSTGHDGFISLIVNAPQFYKTLGRIIALHNLRNNIWTFQSSEQLESIWKQRDLPCCYDNIVATSICDMQTATFIAELTGRTTENILSCCTAGERVLLVENGHLHLYNKEDCFSYIL